MRSLTDALLSTDPLRRVRTSQALLALGLMLAGVATMHYYVYFGIATPRGVWAWTFVCALGIGGAFVLVRSGWSERFEDPSLTVPQMVYAIACSAWAYALVGAGRGGVFPIVMVILMFGMFIATPRQIAWVSTYAVALFGLLMVVLANTRPQQYRPVIEFGHFLTVATMMPTVSILASRLARIRERSRMQRAELTAALARIRELATRDELTGLVNPRHLQELMDQEHQRCIRSGHTFCIAAFEVDDFAAKAAALGDGGAETLLRGVAQESQRYVRVADVLGVWNPGAPVPRFVLLMSDTRAALGRGGLERLRERVAEARIVGDLRVTLSAGLAEHHAGETVAQTLARAEAALAEARQQGRSRILIV
jgi:diguanylate cyclase